MNKIKALVMDVDGTLTDGKIYMGTDGECAKAFDVKDGAGIVLLLPQYSIVPIIITARTSRILENRCKELKISELHQKCTNKNEKLLEVIGRYNIGLDSVSYVGDDLTDIPCMESVKQSGGIVMCPANAIPEIKALADYVSGFKSGEGAIRDCINFILQFNEKKNYKSIVQDVADMVLTEDFSEKNAGVYCFPNGMKYTIQEYETKPENECSIESHRSHIDIQYVISGHEMFKIYSSCCLTSAGTYNPEIDFEYWQGGIEASQSILNPGSLIVVFNGQPHKGAIQISSPEKVKKLICKIEIN